jgi:hypothetical protein
MVYVQWLLVAMIIIVGLVGGYYQLQIVAYLKEGKRTSAWSGGWVMHPEYLEKEGQQYRKKYLGCWLIAILLIIAARTVHT